MSYNKSAKQALKHLLRASVLFLFFGFASIKGFGQNKLSVPGSFNQLNWEDFVRKVETQLPVRFYYEAHPSFSDLVISVKSKESELQQVLNLNLNPLLLFASIDKNGNVFITKDNPLKTELSENFFSSLYLSDAVKPNQTQEDANAGFLKTKKEYYGTTQIIGSKKAGIEEKKGIVSGYISDASDGTSIVGATVFIPEIGEGSATDDSGFFSLTLPKKKFGIVVRNLNYEEVKFQIEVLSSGSLNISLEPKQFTLEGVTVTSQADDMVKGMQMGFEKLSTKAIKSIPTVLGERDILKVALLLPGVQSTGEGSAGFNVRGSPSDQNLFYIENIPVYNTSHLLGFFSTFNSDAIKDFSILKSNMSAKYGGRLSSVFDVTAKQGNKKKFSARGGISPITGKIMAEGPIKKEKSSYLVGARSTYSDWMLQLVDDEDVKSSSAQFADALVHLNFDLDKRNKVRLFSYFSFDDLNYANRIKFGYQNIGISAGWKTILAKKHSLDLSLVHYDYSTHTEDNELPVAGVKQDNDLRHQEAKLHFTFRPNNKHTVEAGINSILYNVNRGIISPASEKSLITAKDLGRERGLESGFYINEEWNISTRFSAAGGLRMNLYYVLGGDNVFKYINDASKIEQNIIDTLSFDNYEIGKSYSGLDFRASLKYLLNDKISLKASVNRLHQYIFLLTNSVSISPTDKWKLIDHNIEPMYGDQFSAGVYSKIADKKLELSVEGYYKKVNNLIEYRDGADLIINEVPEWDLLQGDLDAYGVEFMLKKPYGKLNGWLNYTYSNTSVLVDHPDPLRQINSGIAYPSNYDKPHYFNFVTNYKFTRRLGMSVNLVYSTGRPVTFPTGTYIQDGTQIINYSSRNEFRIPDYFRMDFSVKVEGNLAKKKRIHGTWVFSVYNLIGRRNAYSVYFKNEEEYIRGYKLSIFGAPVFSATYNFKMGNYEN